MRGAVANVAMSKAALVAENALLRQQLIVLQRQVKRPAFTPRDRVALALLARLAHGWRAALLIVQPDTLLRWHRQGYRLVWHVRSATALKRPQVSAATVALIKRMAEEKRQMGGRSASAACARRAHRARRGRRSCITTLMTSGRVTSCRSSTCASARSSPSFPRALRLLYRRSRLAAGRPGRRDATPDRRLGRPAGARGHAVRSGAARPDPRQRRQVWGAVRPCRGGEPHRGVAHARSSTPRERHLREVCRQRSARVPRPPPHPAQRTAAARAPGVFDVL